MISNSQFRKKLDTDLDRKRNVGKLIQDKISELQKKLIQVTSETQKYQKIYQEKLTDLNYKEEQMVSKLQVNQDRIQQIDTMNDDLRKQLEHLDLNINKIKNDI